ncbi:MAG: hypothetical protein HKO66_04950 [Saprospiraceae bacterium]|nr:hypothetical protein [Bacteroidia bacterium]NNL91560.1 hypothetical protein [Saprospiraceae bacterium]
MINRLTFFVLLSFVFNTAVCQTSRKDFSIIKLRNGIVYIGQVTDDSGGQIKINLADDNSVIIDKKKVKTYHYADETIVHDNGKYHAKVGDLYHFSFGMKPFDSSNTGEPTISSHLSFLYGQYYKNKYALGLGFGFEFNEALINGFRIDTQFFPIYGYGRYYISEDKRRPFLYGRLGYGFQANSSEFNNDHEGGVQFQAGAGIHFASRKKTRFIVSLGFHQQHVTGNEKFIDELGSEINVNYKAWIRRFVLNLGFEINKPNRQLRYKY